MYFDDNDTFGDKNNYGCGGDDEDEDDDDGGDDDGDADEYGGDTYE